MSRPKYHAARRAEGKVLGARCADDEAEWLRGKSAHPETSRRDLRMDEDGRRVSEDAGRGIRTEPGDRNAHRSGLQPGPDGQGPGAASVTPASGAADYAP